MIHRRSFITGLVSLVAAPAIVRAGSLMPVRVIDPPIIRFDFSHQRYVQLLFDGEFWRAYGFDHLADRR